MTDEKFPRQHQDRMPALESEMLPRPEYRHPDWRPTGLLEGKVALITGADSGIGRAIAHLFAAEGADIVAGYLDEHDDAHETQSAVEALGRRCLLVSADISRLEDVERLVKETREFTDGIDVLVNNAAVQYVNADFADSSISEIDQTVRTNLLGALYLTRQTLPLIRPSGSILFTTSVTAYRGSEKLVTYAATKGALASLVRSLGEQLVTRDIRVNGVAPGKTWTPLIVGSFAEEDVATFGSEAPIGRAAQPWEIAPSYLFLASNRWSSYIAGQVIHPNGGEAVNA